MIADEMIHGAPARPRNRKRVDDDTPIVPQAVAEAVWEEACVWLGEQLPREWVRRLAVRADLAYTRNAQFHQLMHRSGDAGRDWLWAFSRHWLAALIRRRDQALYSRLPSSFSTGADLPQVTFKHTIATTDRAIAGFDRGVARFDRAFAASDHAIA